MTRTKDPAAHGASARRAVVEDPSRETPRQTDLPLFPDEKGTASRPPAGREGDAVGVEKTVESENASSSRKEKPVRRRQLKSVISVVSIKRVVKAASVAGLPVSSLEVRPDGTIVLGTTGPANDDGEDVFAKWADRL